jgi:hypothetical protein
MLSYVLALVVGLGSLAIYLAAFLFPEIHRKNDFIWSGIGLFYALVLLVFAPIIMGGLLLGHLASVALLVWFGWQTLSLRRQLTPEVQRTPIPTLELIKITIQDTVQRQISQISLSQRLSQLTDVAVNLFENLKNWVQQTFSQTVSKQSAPATPSTAKEPVEDTTTEDTTSIVQQGSGIDTEVIPQLNPTTQITEIEADVVLPVEVVETVEITVETVGAEVQIDTPVTTSISVLSEQTAVKNLSEETLNQVEEGSTENSHSSHNSHIN